MLKNIFLLGGLVVGFAMPSVAQRLTVPVDQLIGINSRASDPLYLLRRFDFVREYHQWNDDVGNAPNSAATCPDDFNTDAFPAYQRYRFNPSFSGAALIRYDDFYSSLYQRTVPVLKGLAPMMRGYHAYPAWSPHLLEQKPNCLTGYYQWWGQTQPPPLWNLPVAQAHPNSYRSHALWSTLMAARFGATSYPSTTRYFTKFLQPHYVTQGWHSTYDDYVEQHPARTGQNLIRYLENNNEPEKSWYDDPAAIAAGQGQTFWQMTAEQFAAQMSADYDGHGQSDYFRIPGLGDSVAWLGIKNADPGLQVVMGGLADLRGQYVEDLMAWCRAHRLPGLDGFQRGPVLPFDVINFHHYSTQFSASDDSGPNSLSLRYADIRKAPIEGQGISPEADNLRGEILYTMNRLEQAEPELKNKELWLSEFGYDSDGPFSAIRVPAIAGQDGQKTQAQWLVRSLLEIAATGRVSKAMLYELRDEPGLYGAHFGYSGLLTADHRPKRAWYYVHSLRNILRGYFFDPEAPNDALISPDLVQVTSGDPSAQDTRVYKFITDDGKEIYAIWSPTATGKAYVASLIFKKYIQFTQASLVTINEMDEDGHWADWTPHIFTEKDGRIRVADLPVNETPLFLVTHSARQDSPAPPLAGLIAQPTCCNAVSLVWKSNPAYRSYRILYGKQSELVAMAPLDFTRTALKMHAPELGGAASSTVVPGLEPGQAYWFYVVPIDKNGALPANWSASPAVAAATPGECNAAAPACLLNIQPNQITYGNGMGVPWNVQEMLGANYQPNACWETASTTTSWNNWDDWDWAGNDPLACAVTIDLQQSFVLSAINLLDSYGKGQLRFEYKNCACDTWQPLLTVSLNVDYDRWMYLTDLRQVPVRYLRITKLDPDAKIRKLFLCGTPAACDPVTQGFQPGLLAGLETGPIRLHSAGLYWPAVPVHQAHPELGFAPAYRIRWSRFWDSDGAFINAREAHVAVAQWETTPGFELTGLEPATKYRAEVVPEAGAAACGAPGAGAWIEFTTPDIDGQSASRQSVQPSLPAALRLQPNPASDLVRVQASAAGYTRLQLQQLATGMIMSGQELQSTDTEWAIDIRQLASGVYLLRLEGAGQPDQTARLVVVR